jgi:predicted nucleic acid-binding protein
MIYADTNFLDAFCRQSDNTSIVDRARRKHPVTVSPLAEYEYRKALFSLPDNDREEAVTRLESVLQAGLVMLEPNWDGAVEKALEIAGQFKDRLAVDSADTLHVGWARLSGCTHFGSFDRRSGPRALAKACGLEVVPPMTQKDWAEMKRLKHLSA